MVFKLIIKPIVFSDLEEAVEYYEKKVTELGKRFYDQFLDAVNDIHGKPFTYSYAKDPVRRCKIKNFPYKIFYLISEDTVFILGLAHAKRSNAFVRRRLRLL